VLLFGVVDDAVPSGTGVIEAKGIQLRGAPLYLDMQVSMARRPQLCMCSLTLGHKLGGCFVFMVLS